MKSIKYFLSFFLVFNALIVVSQPVDSLRYKAAQMLMIGFRGTEISENQTIISDIVNLKIGGVILFEYDVSSKKRPRNISSAEQLKKLCTDLQNLTSDKLLIAIDQEGGAVNRLKRSYGFSSTVSAQYLGKLDNLDSTRFYACQMAKSLSDCGINLNFMPCVDLNINPSCPVVGKIGRSFGANPEIVTKHASLFVEVHRKYGVLTCLKHFPGHGSSKSDSHEGFTDITKTWNDIELQPYKTMIANHYCDAIMSSHVFNSNLDSAYPATLSENIITQLLRDTIGWHGCVFSDDMNMGAISKNFDLKDAIVLTVNAGVDVLVFSNNAPEQYRSHLAEEILNILLELVAEKRITEQRIDESFRRISALKQKLL
jgi:beta-N-acetylhexosaminidase